MYFDFMVSWYISRKTSFDFRCRILSSEFLELNYQIPTEACWWNKVVCEVFVKSCRRCIVKTLRSLWCTNRPEIEQSHLKLRAEKSGHSIPGLFSAMGSKALFARRPKVFARRPKGWNYTWLTLQVGIFLLGCTVILKQRILGFVNFSLLKYLKHELWNHCMICL